MKAKRDRSVKLIHTALIPKECIEKYGIRNCKDALNYSIWESLCDWDYPAIIDEYMEQTYGSKEGG